MRRTTRSQKLFWILSLLVVLSMIGSSLIYIIESLKPPTQPTGPSGYEYRGGPAYVIGYHGPSAGQFLVLDGEAG